MNPLGFTYGRLDHWISRLAYRILRRPATYIDAHVLSWTLVVAGCVVSFLDDFVRRNVAGESFDIVIGVIIAFTWSRALRYLRREIDRIETSERLSIDFVVRMKRVAWRRVFATVFFVSSVVSLSPWSAAISCLWTLGLYASTMIVPRKPSRIAQRVRAMVHQRHIVPAMGGAA